MTGSVSRITTDDIVNAVQECAAELGRLPSQADYEEWRMNTDFDGVRPSRAVVVRKVGEGRWTVAMNVVFPNR
jgi:hypothetical protein